MHKNACARVCLYVCMCVRRGSVSSYLEHGGEHGANRLVIGHLRVVFNVAERIAKDEVDVKTDAPKEPSDGVENNQPFAVVVEILLSA